MQQAGDSWQIRLPDVTAGLDHRGIQRQLLEAPADPGLWLALTRDVVSRRNAIHELHTPAPQPVLMTTAPTSKTETNASQHHPLTISPDTPRPIKRCFHPEGSSRAEEVRLEQLTELQALAERKQHDDLLKRLGADLVAPLAALLTPAVAYGLGHRAYVQERFEVAAPLLAAVVESGPRAGDLLPWAKLFLALSYRGLGEICQARESLLLLHCESAGHEVDFHAQLALAWLDLNAGKAAEATSTLDRLRQDPQARSNLTELDLLGRVLSTLQWLKANPRDEISKTVDRANSDGLAVAIDEIRLSRCGKLLQLKGWLVDPDLQLRELCLVRGERVWRLNLGEACYTERPDLADVVARCGGNCDLHPGLTIFQIAMPEEAVPWEAGEAAELFAVLTNGSQFCLRRSLQGFELNNEQIKAVLGITIQKSFQLVSANLLHRVRELWKMSQLSKQHLPVEHKQFGAPPAMPELSIVIPLYGRVDFMEYQLNWFNAWQRRKGPARASLQLIYVLDDPRLRQECLALAQRCHTLYSIPFELVLNPENLGYPGANNNGAEFVKAPLLLLLNSDVLPAQENSLELMLRTMQQNCGDIGALGARLLYDNGAIQHLGMKFVQEPDLDGELGSVWLNEHPFKGVKLPRLEGESLTLLEVEAATAACLMLESKCFRQLGGLSSYYIVGDFEDSDLCLRLRSKGLPILIDREASFYHLERQSLALDSRSSDDMKSKVVTTNAITHHQLWCSAIERLHRCEVNQ